MKTGMLVFVLAFAGSAVSGLLGTGCFGAECDCPPPPERPAPQAALSGLEVVGFDAAGNSAALEVEPESGTLEVTTAAVIIRYRQDGADHEIRYEITDPDPP